MAITPSLERAYDFITGEDDEGRACEAIPEEACTDVPRNFFLNALNGAATKLGEQLASPSLVLPWLLDAMGAPAFLTGWLVPVRRSLALLPQLAIAGRIREYELRKWFWAGGAAAFALAIVLMVPAGALFSPTTAGIAIILLLAAGSIGRGVSSVAFKDVLAKTIPQGRRGTLLATRATAGGILTLGAGLLLRLYVADEADITPYLILVASGGILWFVGAAIVTAIAEEPGATGGGRNALEEARAGMEYLREQTGFRRFLVARALLLSVQLSIPFYALYARELTGGLVSGLSLFVMATGLAEVLSSPFWGRFSDRSSRTVMMAGGGLAIAIGIIALVIGALPQSWHQPWLLALVFLIVGFAKAGVRLGRKTYLVDGTPEVERPTYVALSNTIIGAITLASGTLGVVVQVFGVRALLVTFVALTALGVFMAWRMPEAENMVV